MDKTCRRCGYVGDSWRNLRRHLERARPCEAVVADVEREVQLAKIVGYIREACNKTYTREWSLRRHETTCVVKQVIKHVGEVTTLPESALSPVTSATEVKTSIVPARVRSFMNENIDYLVRDVDLMQKVLSQPGNVAVNLIREIHFNMKRPENANIYMNTEDDEKGFVYSDGCFVKRTFLRIADMLLVNMRHIINDFFDYVDDQDDVEFDEELRLSVEDQMHNMIRDYNTTYESCKLIVRECSRLSQRMGVRPVDMDAKA